MISENPNIVFSFIVIGRNSERTIRKCLRSIENVERVLNCNSEVIYVDSQSSDDSLRIVQDEFPVVTVIYLTEDYNAAIGRNVGAELAQGDSLIFVDSDMELDSEFVLGILDEECRLVYPFVSGDWLNVFYDSKGEYLSQKPYRNLKQDKYDSTTGGLFCITRQLWFSCGEMDVRFKRGQDLDFGIRMKSRGTPLLRKAEIAAKHHTISYLSNTRMWKDLPFQLYSRTLLYRKHLFNKFVWAYLLRQEYSVFIALISIFSSGLFSSPMILLVIPGVYLLRSKGINTRLLYFPFRDLLVSLGFVFFWPTSSKKIEYSVVDTGRNKLE